LAFATDPSQLIPESASNLQHLQRRSRDRPVMLKYLFKFVLDILPPVTATVIGAFVVSHYINPPAHSDVAKAAVAATAIESKPPAESPSKVATSQATADKQEPASSASEAVAITKPADSAGESKAKTAMANAPGDARHRSVASREKAPAKAASVASVAAAAPTPVNEVSPSSADERRDANEIARAAIERLRSTVSVAERPASERASEPARSVAKVATIVPATQIPLSAPPLPPAVNVSAPPMAPALNPEARDDRDSGDRDARESGRLLPPIPPADIPAAQRSLDAQASIPDDSAVSNDGVFGVVRSVFRAVTPH
jgi:hypothetical protein